MRALASHGVDDFVGEGHVRALVAEHPGGAGGEARQQAARAQEVDVSEGTEEEQALDAAREAGEVEQEAALVVVAARAFEREYLVGPALTELGLAADRGNVLDGRKRLCAALGIGHVVVQQREIELDVQRFLEQLSRQVHARFGRIDVPVQTDDEIVRHDRIARGEEGHQPFDQMPVRRRHALAQMAEIDLEIDLFHRPGVLDRRAIHLVEAWIAHGAKGEVEAGVE